MTDRESLLAAIKANPRDDLPRLVYADWLDEFGTTDLDAATSEFIRASVAFKGGQKHPVGLGGTMAPAGYEWLHDNWHRLVPCLMRNTTVRNFRRCGRDVETEIWADGGLVRYFQRVWVRLVFSNGWLRMASWWNSGRGEGRWLYDSIVRDQPQVEAYSVGTPVWEERERRRAELNAQRERMQQDRVSELVAGLESLRTILADRGVQGI